MREKLTFATYCIYICVKFQRKIVEPLSLAGGMSQMVKSSDLGFSNVIIPTFQEKWYQYFLPIFFFLNMGHSRGKKRKCFVDRLQTSSGGF